jgi:iron complex transport system ATP-binding protein
MTELRLENISVETSAAPLLKNVSARLASGEFAALIGPNGAGKTTLLKCALGLIEPSSGAALIDGASVHGMAPMARARRIAYLPQIRPLAWPIRVRDVVALGRYAFGAAMASLKGADADAVERALSGCGLKALADRHTDTLSGGELARVHVARALASEAPLLLADEPMASLDPSHQLQVLSLIAAHVRNGGGAMVVMHDIALAARFAHRLIWLKDGEIVADGPPAETLTQNRMAEIFAVDARITKKDSALTLDIVGETQRF